MTSHFKPLHHLTQHAQVPVYSQSSCSILWSPSNYTDTNCCAGSLNGDGAACTSDAGGPLMSEISTRPLRYTLVGIVSWTQGMYSSGF